MTSEPKPLTRCPLCGSKKIRREAITLHLKGVRAVPNVAADVCSSCHEQFLDLTVARKLDELRRDL